MRQLLERFRVPELRPLMVLAVASMALAILLTWAFLLRPGSPAFIGKLEGEAIYLAIAVVGLPVLFYFWTGLGTLFLRKWGYRLLTAFLYIHIFVGPPVTTVFADRGLSYIRTSRIRRHFGIPTGLDERTTLSRLAKVAIALIGAVLIGLWILVMLTA